MGLTLVKTLGEMSQTEVEEKLAYARMRRMSASVQLQQAEQKRLNAEATKVRERMGKQIVMLGKEITRLDTAIEKVETRLNTVLGLKNELEFVEEYGE